MATKTISVDLEAYDRLSAARMSPRESFSRVIKRARWDQPGHTCGRFLETMTRLAKLDPSVLARLDAAQAADQPPEDPWQKP